jgi:DNA-binding NtrC family response regulator
MAKSKQKRFRVLIVDDERGSRETLQDILREEGYEVVIAGDGVEALKFAADESFQIALLDIKLPGMDGVELLGKLRKMSPETAVIMITAYATVENSIEALNLGAYSYLTKPLNIDEVKAHMRRVVDNLRLSEERDNLLVETNAWAGQLQVLNEMTRSINSSHDVKILLKVMSSEMKNVIEYNNIIVSLLDHGTSTIEVINVDSAGVNIQFVASQKILKSHAVGWVIRMQEPLVTEKLMENSPFEDEQEKLKDGFHSRLIVPFILRGDATGALVLESRNEGQYSQDNLKLLKLIGRHLSVALENARMYEELVRTKEALEVENVDLKTKVGGRYSFGNIIAQSAAIEEILRLMRRVINSSSTVFLVGESGTGKELLANVLHYQGPRKDKPFVIVNCGAIPENLLESELFGYEKGAFTGADKVKEGLFERANEGTFFLDEVDELSKSLQVKLLRVLQDGEVRRLGAVSSKFLDVRVIAATSRNIKKLVEEGKFREDLFYRLHVYPIEIPPLRDRREDILPLAEFFLEKYKEKTPNRIKDFSPASRNVLLQHNWPGNVRELEHVIEKSVHLADGKWVEPEDLGLGLDPRGEKEAAKWTLRREREDLMRKRVEEALRNQSGNKARAARELGIHRTQLYRYLKRYDLN